MLSEAGVAVFIKDSNIILYNETKQGFDGKSPTLSPYMAVPPRASVEVVLGLFLPKHCTITPERATLNLAGI